MHYSKKTPLPLAKMKSKANFVQSNVLTRRKHYNHPLPINRPIKPTIQVAKAQRFNPMKEEFIHSPRKVPQPKDETTPANSQPSTSQIISPSKLSQTLPPPVPFSPSSCVPAPTSSFFPQPSNQTMSKWLFPTSPDGSIRRYQLQITETALFHNTLVCLPTGLGKTLIASVVAYNFLRWFPTGKVVFMAPTRQLLTQQRKACQKVMGVKKDAVIVMTGQRERGTRKAEWESRRLFFVTPHILQNDAEAGIVPGRSIVCVILDEAHRAIGKDAMAQSIRSLEASRLKHFVEWRRKCQASSSSQHETSTTDGFESIQADPTTKYSISSADKEAFLAHDTGFRIIGLSATPGTNEIDIQHILTNLRIEKIEVRDEFDADLQAFTHTKQFETVSVPLSSSIQNVQRLFYHILTLSLQRLAKLGCDLDIRAEFLRMSVLLQARESYRQHQRAEREAAPATPFPIMNRNPNQAAVEGEFGVLLSLVQGIRLLKDHGVQSFRNFLVRFQEDPKSRARKNLISSRDWTDLIAMVNDMGTSGITHPKIDALKTILTQHFAQFKEKEKEKVGEGGQEDANETRVIVFSEFRDSVGEIAAQLNQLDPQLIRAAPFVGKGGASVASKKKAKPITDPSHLFTVGIDTRQTDRDQSLTLAKFRTGEYNVIVSTSIGEEGLDIGEVDLCVLFDTPPSYTRFAQRIGRTGRKKEGKVVMLVVGGDSGSKPIDILAGHDRKRRKMVGLLKEAMMYENTLKANERQMKQSTITAYFDANHSNTTSNVMAPVLPAQTGTHRWHFAPANRIIGEPLPLLEYVMVEMDDGDLSGNESDEDSEEAKRKEKERKKQEKEDKERLRKEEIEQRKRERSDKMLQKAIERDLVNRGITNEKNTLRGKSVASILKMRKQADKAEKTGADTKPKTERKKTKKTPIVETKLTEISDMQREEIEAHFLRAGLPFGDDPPPAESEMLRDENTTKFRMSSWVKDVLELSLPRNERGLTTVTDALHLASDSSLLVPSALDTRNSSLLKDVVVHSLATVDTEDLFDFDEYDPTIFDVDDETLLDNPHHGDYSPPTTTLNEHVVQNRMKIVYDDSSFSPDLSTPSIKRTPFSQRVSQLVQEHEKRTPVKSLHEMNSQSKQHTTHHSPSSQFWRIGPTHKSPKRALYQPQLPNEDDLNNFAENLENRKIRLISNYFDSQPFSISQKDDGQVHVLSDLEPVPISQLETPQKIRDESDHPPVIADPHVEQESDDFGAEMALDKDEKGQENQELPAMSEAHQIASVDDEWDVDSVNTHEQHLLETHHDPPHEDLPLEPLLEAPPLERSSSKPESLETKIDFRPASALFSPPLSAGIPENEPPSVHIVSSGPIKPDSPVLSDTSKTLGLPRRGSGLKAMLGRIRAHQFTLPEDKEQEEPAEIDCIPVIPQPSLSIPAPRSAPLSNPPPLPPTPVILSPTTGAPSLDSRFKRLRRLPSSISMAQADHPPLNPSNPPLSPKLSELKAVFAPPRQQPIFQKKSSHTTRAARLERRARKNQMRTKKLALSLFDDEASSTSNEDSAEARKKIGPIKKIKRREAEPSEDDETVEEEDESLSGFIIRTSQVSDEEGQTHNNALYLQSLLTPPVRRTTPDPKQKIKPEAKALKRPVLWTEREEEGDEAEEEEEVDLLQFGRGLYRTPKKQSKLSFIPDTSQIERYRREDKEFRRKQKEIREGRRDQQNEEDEEEDEECFADDDAECDEVDDDADTVISEAEENDEEALRDLLDNPDDVDDEIDDTAPFPETHQLVRASVSLGVLFSPTVPTRSSLTVRTLSFHTGLSSLERQQSPHVPIAPRNSSQTALLNKNNSSDSGSGPLQFRVSSLPRGRNTQPQIQHQTTLTPHLSTSNSSPNSISSQHIHSPPQHLHSPPQRVQTLSLLPDPQDDIDQWDSASENTADWNSDSEDVNAALKQAVEIDPIESEDNWDDESSAQWESADTGRHEGHPPNVETLPRVTNSSQIEQNSDDDWNDDE
ncbi:putative Fanconi anemia group M protein [Blattamonas nauphoetae]|uniref:Fanconi anemia group M protein n=1 Tax=Blattamonas nauphoetae TaxID=2049346 RepID=A0ABQ9YFW6_9EUKA|nr:putative Fanconi anemia group M protein [Blattamonas nauphoetae]